MKKTLGIAIAVSFLLVVLVCSALGQQTLQWKSPTCWTPVMSLIEADKNFAKLVGEMSGGRLQIKIFSAGELVPVPGIFDAISSGNLESACDWPGYWGGRNTAFELLGTCPLGLDQYDYVNWYYHYGGKELYNAVYGKYNMIYFMHSVSPMESGVRSRVPIKSLAEYKGKKTRVSGKAAGYVMSKVGLAPVSMSGGEIYQALQLGTLDAAEFSIPAVDFAMGLQEVTKFNATPGWHQPASAFGFMINKGAWNKLPDDLKKAIELACLANNAYMNSWYEVKNIDAINNFKKAGVQVNRISEKEIDSIEKFAWEFVEKESKANPDFQKVALSMFQYMKDFIVVREYQDPFKHGRIPKTLPNIGLK